MRVAAICAYSDARNPGMMSVDEGLLSFLARNGIEADVDFFSIARQLDLPAAGPGYPRLTYQLLRDVAQLEGYDRIVYWGDFLHCRQYHQQDLRNWIPERFSPEGIDDEIYRLLLLEGAPEEMLRTVICFGGSLYLNGPLDDADPRYRAALGRLYSHAKLVLTRDLASAAYAQAHGASGSGLGVDAAFLFAPPPSGGARDGRPRVGVALNRTRRRHRLARLGMRRFTRKLAAAIGGEVVNIDWLGPDPQRPLESLKQRIDTVRQCTMLVTDIYHCSITGWREGVPTVCFGNGAVHPQTTLSDKKKELLYTLINARPFYLFTEQMGAPWVPGPLARTLAAAGRDAALVGAVRSNILAHVSRSEAQLLAAFSDD